MTEFANTEGTVLLDELAQRLREGFAPAKSASVAVAADPAHAMEILGGVRPGAAAVVLFYDGDAADGEDDLDGDTLVEARVSAAVVQHPGLAAKPAQSAPGALRMAQDLRKFIAALAMGGALEGWNYAGMASLQNYAGEILHGYALTWRCRYAFDIQ